MPVLDWMTPKTVMARLVRSISALQEGELSRLGIDLTAQQAGIVAYVEVEGAKSIGEIATRIGVDQSVATRLVDRLEAKGHLLRTRHPVDGRAVQVLTTEVGSSAVDVFLPAIEALKQRVFAGVRETDLDVFWRVLTELENNVTGWAGSAEGTLAASEPKARAAEGL